MLDREVFSVYLLRLCVLVVSLLQTVVVTLVNKTFWNWSLNSVTQIVLLRTICRTIFDIYWLLLFCNFCRIWFLTVTSISTPLNQSDWFSEIGMSVLTICSTYLQISDVQRRYCFGRLSERSSVKYSGELWSPSPLFFAYSWSPLLQSNVINLKCYTLTKDFVENFFN